MRSRWWSAARVPTINFRTDFLRPAGGDGLLATATIRRAGRTIGVVDVDVHDGEGPAGRGRARLLQRQARLIASR